MAAFLVETAPCFRLLSARMVLMQVAPVGGWACLPTALLYGTRDVYRLCARPLYDMLRVYLEQAGSYTRRKYLQASTTSTAQQPDTLFAVSPRSLEQWASWVPSPGNPPQPSGPPAREVDGSGAETLRGASLEGDQGSQNLAPRALPVSISCV